MLGMRVLSLSTSAKRKAFPNSSTAAHTYRVLGHGTGVEREGASLCSGGVGVACSFLHAEPTARLNIYNTLRLGTKTKNRPDPPPKRQKNYTRCDRVSDAAPGLWRS